MNVNKQVSYFSRLLKDHLELHKTVLENDITMLLDGTAIEYIHDKKFQDIERLQFVYAAESLNIFFWAEDSSDNVITKSGHRLGKIENDNNFPNKLQIELAEFEDENIDDDNFDDFLDAFDNIKYEIVENWFLQHWQSAREKVDLSKDAYFSIHDSNYKTKLK